MLLNCETIDNVISQYFIGSGFLSQI